MRIKKLAAGVRSMLESGVIISDATQCVLELVENSLDAKCTAVAVRINLKDYKIEVVDNGTGVSPEDLNLVGKRFMTSKCRNTDDLNRNMTTFGYRGQAIASILDVSSKLIIKTKSESSSKTLVKVFTKGKSPSVSVSSKDKTSTGTTITVYDFMSTMPVRQKRIAEIFDLKEIKNQLEYLALIHNEVDFTLRDDNKGEIILQSHKRRNCGFSFADLFGMAIGKFLVPLNYTDDKTQVEGFIGLQRHTENNLQFFYVNKRIVSKSITHKFINGLIDKYLNESRSLSDESPLLNGINLSTITGCHNVYLVQIRCPYSDYDIFRNLRKTTVEFKNWDRIFRCLKSAIKAGLKVESVSAKMNQQRAGNLPKKVGAEFRQLKCGIQGVVVNRKQCRVVLSDKETVRNRVNVDQRRISNDSDLIDGMRNDFTGTSILRSLTIDYSEMNHNTEGMKNLVEYGQKSGLDIQRRAVEAVDDFSIEFAVWLKSKMENDNFLRQIYSEFVKNNSKLGKRKRENERNCDQSKEVRREVKKWVKLMKDRKSDLRERLQTANVEGEVVKKFKNGNGNELITPTFADSNNFVRGEIEKFVIRDSINCFPREESSKSWVSHENRANLNEKCYPKKRRKGKLRFVTKKDEENVGLLVDSMANNRREVDVQTSVAYCDKGIQIDLQDVYETSNGNVTMQLEEENIFDDGSQVLFSSTPLLEYRNQANTELINSDELNITGLNVERNRGLVSPTEGIVPAKRTISDCLHIIVDTPDLTNHKNLENVVTTQTVSRNLPDTLSIGHIANSNGIPPFVCVNRYDFIPKGLSPTVLERSFGKLGLTEEGMNKRNDKASDCIWEGNSCELFTKSLLPEEFVEELKERTAENMIYYESELVKSFMTKAESKINALVGSFAVDKEVLSKVKVIGQWDKKFIIAKTCPTLPEEKHLLFIFDQHAVDERIRLEKLLKDSRNIEGKFIATSCNPPLKCKMDESTLRLIPSLEKILLRFGVKLSIVDSEHVLLNEIPACFTEDNVDNAESFLKKLVKEVFEELKETRGTGSSIPRVLYTMMTTRACKSALKFNENLTGDEMARMISDLVLCQIPFRCAHGRPSVVPILDLEAFANQVKKTEEKLNFRKFMKMKE